MFLVEWHTLHVPGSVFEQLWQLSHSDYCLLSSLTCEWKCSETDRNKAGMWWRWLWQLYCAHLKVSSCHCQYRVCSSFLFSSVFCHQTFDFFQFLCLYHPILWATKGLMFLTCPPITCEHGHADVPLRNCSLTHSWACGRRHSVTDLPWNCLPLLPCVLWHSWLDNTKGIRPLQNLFQLSLCVFFCNTRPPLV